MKVRSLTFRVVIGALIWIAVALGAGGYAVLEVFRDSAIRQFDQNLADELTLVSVAVSTSPGDPGRHMTSPSFSRVYSGLYWQADQADGPRFKSRSLWDWSLPIASPGAQIASADVAGPDDQELRMVTRQILAPDGAIWSIAVAADLSTLEAETALFQRGILPAALSLGAVLILAALLLLHTALTPLRQLRAAVRSLHADDDDAIRETFPSEVAPLVDDLNSMLAKNRRLRERGRAQAANLAHALKTPAAILQNEMERAGRGKPMDLALAGEAVDRIATTAQRHASQAIADPSDQHPGEKYDAVPVLDEVVRAIRRLFPQADLLVDIPESLALPMPPADQHEIFGNLLENAGKWARSRILVRLVPGDRTATLTIEDDGIGVPETDRGRILHQGVRLDPTRAGSGLGLTIVDDIVERYRGNLDLATSSLGGLLVRVTLPRVQQRAGNPHDNVQRDNGRSTEPLAAPELAASPGR